MKVVHYINSIDKSAGGTAKFLQLTVNAMKEDLKISIATRFSKNELSIPNVEIKKFDLSISRWFVLKKEFFIYLKEEQPDLVHINGIWNPQNYLFQMVAQQLGIKIVLSPHGMLEPYILKRNWFKKQIALELYQKKALKSVNFFHATADSELNQIRALCYKQSMAVIPNGIDLSEISQKKSRNIEKVKNILFLSRVHPKKGIDLLIEAVAKITIKNFNVIIAGEGDEKYINFLKGYAIKHDVYDVFKFVGPLYGDSKNDAFEKADLFVLPTHSENFGIVIVEALAANIPVITTTGAPWEELNIKHCGWWVKLNLANLKNTLEEAINKTPEEIIIMGGFGRKLVEEKYDIKIVAKQMKAFYRWVCKEDNKKPEFIKD